MRSLLLSFAVSILLPCYIVIFLVIRPLFQLAMPSFQLIAEAHFPLLPDSQFHDQYPIPFDQLMPFCNTIMVVSRHKKEVEQVKCVFCLSDIEEGEEVRELRCKHLFHRRCLDRWLEFGRVTCPLCRIALVPFEVKAKVAEISSGGMEMNDSS